MKDYKSTHSKQMKLFRTVGIIVLALVLLAGLGYVYAKYGRQFFQPETPEVIEPLEEEVKPEVEVPDTKPVVLVHIDGAVQKPGVVELKEGDRVKDAVEAAGGLQEKADVHAINLAAEVVDGSKIYIPKVGETQVPVEASTGQGAASSDGKVNINTATKDELMKLPGVGSSTAESILEERKKGKFKSIQDLKRISGIGEKKFEKLKDHIRV